MLQKAVNTPPSPGAPRPGNLFQENGAVATSVLDGLGQALRWLRDRNRRKQYQVAEAAGITKGMLSSYETGRQRPSLETLGKVLGTRGCTLHDLHNAIEIVNGRPGQAPPKPWPDRGFPDLSSVLGYSNPLPRDLENAFEQLLEGFHQLVRYMHSSLLEQLPGKPDGEPSGDA